jgi:hypothetical protein
VAKAPISVLNLEQNCKAFNNHLILTPWFQENSSSRVLNNKLHTSSLFWSNITTNHLWKELHINLHNFSNFKIPNELKPFTNIPLDALVSRLNYLKHIQLEQTTSFPLLAIILIISGAFVVVIAKYNKSTQCIFKCHSV